MLSIHSDVNNNPLAQIKALQEQLVMAKMAVTAEEGMEAEITKALIQLHRFVLAHIEVDTARTKHSIFMETHISGDSVIGKLGTNVKYSPYVRDANHKEPFFRYAARIEGPRVLEALGREFTMKLYGVFA